MFNNSKMQRALLTLALVSLAMLMSTGTAVAQLPMAPSTQFDVTGFIEEAILDPTCATLPNCGGFIKVNGHVITVPKETIVILPANALSWQELFAQAPLPFGLTATGVGSPYTGLAKADCPNPAANHTYPLTTYEAQVVGNRVNNVYIAGLIYISQQGLNSGAGYINYIDYNLGELRVGGIIGDPTTGTRVQLNDPLGRYGRPMTPDKRFTVDADNPTIKSETGFPMCLPRTDPATASDPLCPQSNRPKDVAGNFLPTMMFGPPATPGAPNDSTQQAPFEIGDYVTFAGTLVRDPALGYQTAGDWPISTTTCPSGSGTQCVIVSAHTITNNIAIYTLPGTNPAYVAVEVALIGTGGLTVLGAGEAAIRTRFEGFTTDPSRYIHLYGIDLDPATGATTDRDWGTIGVDQGAPTGAVKGRWRFRPPCTATTPSATNDKQCTPPPAGTFLPPTRELRAVIQGAWTPPLLGTQSPTAANGLIWGQYHAPILEYIFPENIPGTPIVENNFNAINFLAFGGYTSSTGFLAKQLSPWPSAVAPTPTCTASANAGGPYAVASKGTVTLAASASGTPTLSYAWAAPAVGTLSSLTVFNPVYTAPNTATQTVVGLTVTVTSTCGASSVASTTVTIAPTNPVVNAVPPINVNSGALGSFPLSGVDPSGLPLTFTVVQTGTPALLNLLVTSTGNTTANVTFLAPILPTGQVTPSVVTLTITASDGTATSAPVLTTVTINPPTDVVTLTAAEYRTSKQRLIVNATDSIISPNIILILLPYATSTGTIYNPDPAAGGVGNVFTNNGGGLYIIDLVGAPPPACGNPAGYQTPCPATPIQVRSNLGYTTPGFALTRIRQ